MHVPADVESINEEFFAQLCAEHQITRYNRSGVATHTVWEEHRDRNEALDCSVLCLAALRLLNPNIRQMASSLAESAARVVVDQRAPDQPPPPPLPSAPVRRVTRSSYLGR